MTVRVLFLAHAYPPPRRRSGRIVRRESRRRASRPGSGRRRVGAERTRSRRRRARRTASGASLSAMRPTATRRSRTPGTMGAQVRDTLSGKVAMLSYLVSAYRAARGLRSASDSTALMRTGGSRRAGGVGPAARRPCRSSPRCTAPISDSRRPFPSVAGCSDEWRGKGAP
jgi:hypothetical protein